MSAAYKNCTNNEQGGGENGGVSKQAFDSHRSVWLRD